jgi:Zn-ribbon RNA-binding protein
MSEGTDFCVSCGIRLNEKGAVKFKCPGCGAELGRCAKCRQQANIYKCQKCGFQGP